MELGMIVAKIFGGLALFLFAIGQLSQTLKRLAGTRLKQLLQRVVGGPWRGVTTGAVVTFLVQSSSVTVLLLLGMVNAGIINLRQAVYVILGSEVGTTITAQVVAFKVATLFYPLLIFGFIFKVVVRREKLKDGGEFIFSLGLIFLAMKIMSDGARPLRDYPVVIELISSFGVYPLLGIAIGAVLTAITSSSSATTSLIIAMGMEGVIGLGPGIALMIGANIGTCVLELIASVGTSVSARRTGLAQFVINLCGALLFFPFLDLFAQLVTRTAADLPRQLANGHAIFNITVSLLFMPLVGPFITLLKRLVPGDEEGGGAYGILDEKFLEIPVVALYEAEAEVHRMAGLVGEMLLEARQAFFLHSHEAQQRVVQNELQVEEIHEQLTVYLGRISNVMLSEVQIKRKRALFHVIGDIKRVADIAHNLAGYGLEKDARFSETALRELEQLFERSGHIFEMSIQSLRRRKKSIAMDINHMEENMGELELAYRQGFVQSQKKDYLVELPDIFYPSVLKDLERIGNHANNIAEHVMSM